MGVRRIFEPGAEVNVTLCGCLRISDEEYEWDRTRRLVKRHYRDNPQCVFNAQHTPIWMYRWPLNLKRDEAEDEEVPSHIN